jgi:menaquinol-cytochrome c reductase iron-sulfur subunit
MTEEPEVPKNPRGYDATQNLEGMLATATGRRSFLGALLALGGACVGALLSVPLVRFAIFPLIRETTDTKWAPLGGTNEVSSLSNPVVRIIQIERLDGWRRAISEKAEYITKDPQGQVRVLSSVCPHLGCTVPWIREKKQFVCPCHNAIFSADGARIGGPALRGMDTLETKIEDGQLQVRFQYFRQLVATKEVIG